MTIYVQKAYISHSWPREHPSHSRAVVSPVKHGQRQSGRMTVAINVLSNSTAGDCPPLLSSIFMLNGGQTVALSSFPAYLDSNSNIGVLDPFSPQCFFSTTNIPLVPRLSCFHSPFPALYLSASLSVMMWRIRMNESQDLGRWTTSHAATVGYCTRDTQVFIYTMGSATVCLLCKTPPKI